jgi:hypothetical protein
VKTYLRWRGAVILPYVDNFLLFASAEEEALTLRQHLPKPLDHLGLLCHLASAYSDTTASRTPPENRHRHNVMLLLRAGDKTHQSRATSQTTHRTSYTERTLATRQGPSITRRPGTMPFVGNSSGHVIPP